MGSSLFSMERSSPILVARPKRRVTGTFWLVTWEHDVQAVSSDGGKIGQKFHSPTRSVGCKIQIPALLAFNAGICCLKASAFKLLKAILG